MLNIFLIKIIFAQYIFLKCSASRSSSETIQLIVTYTSSDGRVHKRVITDGCPYAEGPAEFNLSLNQSTASVVVARMATLRCIQDSPKDVFAWVDRTLLRMTKRVAQHLSVRDDPLESTAPGDPFGEAYSEYPRNMYFLRRSNFLQYFNSTPDETAYWRHHLIGQPAREAHRMFCPDLVSYTANCVEPAAVPLSMDSVGDECVLVCDAFFYVAVFLGSSFKRVMKLLEGGETVSSYEEALGAVVRRAVLHAREGIMKWRSPVPSYVECSQNSSNSRFLLCLLDPGSRYSTLLSPPPAQVTPSQKKSSSFSLASLYSLITSYYASTSTSSPYRPSSQNSNSQQASAIPSEDISLSSFIGYLMKAYPNYD